jgi:hypothetical protein
VQHWNISPTALAKDREGADAVVQRLRDLYALQEKELEFSNYLHLRRGPYHIASVFEESNSAAPLQLTEQLVNIFDHELQVHNGITLQPGERGVFVDLDWIRENAPKAKVIAASTRIRNEQYKRGLFSFEAHGPLGTQCRIRIYTRHEPQSVKCEPEQHCGMSWDEASSTVLLEMDNIANAVKVSLEFGK